MGLLDKIQARLEISRLEKRYTKDRSKRATWTSEAHYVNGEYVYGEPGANDTSPSSSRHRQPDSKWSKITVRPLALGRNGSYRS